MRKKPLTQWDSDQLSRLGERIRAARRGRLSLEECATIAGLSVGQLSQIENGVGNPTVETLTRIALVFNVPIADLLEPAPAGQTHVVTAEQRRQMTIAGSTHTVDLLTPGIHHDMTASYHQMGPGESRAVTARQGHVLYYVLEGHLEVVGAGETLLLDAEDSVLSQVPHELRTTSMESSVFIGVFRADG